MSTGVERAPFLELARLREEVKALSANSNRYVWLKYYGSQKGVIDWAALH